MDWRLAKRLGLSTSRLPKTLEASALDGRWLCHVTHRTQPIQLVMANNHTEFLSFHLYYSQLHPIILGFPWLIKHNSHFDWSTGEVTGWSEGCSLTCFSSVSALEPPRPPDVSPPVFPESPATPEPPASAPPPTSADQDFPDLSCVPPCYLDLKEAFSKARAASLPPHRPYDCAIDLLPGTSPPRGRLYSLSAPEMEAMNKYIESSLAAGIIRPSSSPAGAGVFVEKKDKMLVPASTIGA